MGQTRDRVNKLSDGSLNSIPLGADIPDVNRDGGGFDAAMRDIYGQTPQPFTSSSSTRTETTETADQMIDRLYHELLGRHVDSSGLNYWKSVCGRNETCLRNGIQTSDEYQRRQQNPSTPARREMIRRLYRELLGREPDPGGWDFWDRSGLSETELRSEFVRSEEYRARARGLAQREAIPGLFGIHSRK